MPATLGRALERPFDRRARAARRRRVVCSARNVSVGEPVLEQVPVQRQRDAADRFPGCRREVQVGLARERRRARIDDHERRARASAPRLQIRHEVDAGRRRVHAPEHDQPCVDVVLVGDAGHLAVERQVGGAGRRGADRAREPRRAEAAKQRRVVGVLREQAVRSAVAERQDRFGAGACRGSSTIRSRDVVERFVPASRARRRPAPSRPCESAG